MDHSSKLQELVSFSYNGVIPISVSDVMVLLTNCYCCIAVSCAVQRLYNICALFLRPEFRLEPLVYVCVCVCVCVIQF